MAGFPDDILQQLATAFQPIQDALSDSSGQKLQALLANFGWTYTPVGSGISGALAASPFGQIITDVSNVLTDVEPPTPDLEQLTIDVPKLISDLQSLQDPTASLASAAAPFSLSQFWNGTTYTSSSGTTTTGPAFVDDLLGYLVCNYVLKEVPLAYGLLRFVGVFSTTQWPAVAADASTGFPGRAAYTQQAVDATKLLSAISQPQNVFADVYNWGSTTDTFAADLLLQNLAAVFGAFNVAASVLPTSDSLYALYYDPLATSPTGLSQLAIMPFSYALGTGGSPVAGNFKISLNALPIPPNGSRTGAPVGFVLFPLATGQVQAQIALTTNVAVSLNGNFSLIPILIEIRPTGVAITALSSSSGAQLTLNAEARIDATSPANSPWTLIGDPDRSNLSLAGVHFSIDANGPAADPTQLTIKIELGLDSLALNIDFGDADSFLSSIFGSGVQSIQASPSLTWSNKAGFGFSGQAALTASIPIHQTILDVITLDMVTVALGVGSPGGTAVALSVAVSGSATLGPINATVDQVGFQIDLDTKPSQSGTGNTGVISSSLGFLPPKGLGLSLDLPPASGGGYISFDPTKGEYSGILSVAIDAPAAEIQISIIGLLDTQLPNHPGDFSFLLIVSVEFTPIQLGLGFTLNGVGGIGGLNRSVSTTALQTGFHNHTLDNILFPQDPIGQATQIIGAVSATFPVAVGHYVLGPVLKLGWGTPTIVTVELGIIVTFPEPVILALLGQLLVGLPTADDPDQTLILIQVDILGTVDFSQQTLAIDATLYGSRIVMFPIAGDMSLRLGWGASPEFVITLGGFNPHFQPPANIPPLQRLSISIGDSNTGLSLTTYLAVTSNTLQFGAGVQAQATAGGFGVRAQMSFDALFIFSPFSFIVDMKASAEIVAGTSVLMSIDLSLTLSGPQPWRVQGTASFTILFFSVAVNFDLTIGNPAHPTPLPQIAVLPKLLAAFQATGNWRASLNDDLRFAVSLASPTPGDTSLVVHPMGQLQVTENVVPLDLPIDKFGNGTPSDGSRFTISAVTVNSKTPNHVADNPGEFARAQFQTMSDGDKLAAQSFEPSNAGKIIGSSAITPGTPSSLTLTYETYYIDDPLMPATRIGPLYQPLLQTMMSNVRQAAAAQARANTPGPLKYVSPGKTSPVVLNDPQYVVVQLSDLSTTSITAPTTQGYAQAALDTHVSANPQAAGTLAVLPTYEAAA